MRPSFFLFLQVYKVEEGYKSREQRVKKMRKEGVSVQMMDRRPSYATFDSFLLCYIGDCDEQE